MPFGYLAIAAASSVAQLWNGYRQRQHGTEMERRREIHQMKVIRQQHEDALERLDIQNEFTAEQNQIAQEEAWKRQANQQQHTEKMHRKSRALQRDMERLRWELARLAEGYPIKRGPFHLRRHLQLAHPGGFPGRMPPVVLIPPLRDESNKETWANARLHAQYLLGGLFGDGLIHIPQGMPDRAFTWPDADLYRFDLLDVPTIVVSATAAPAGVNIWLGGCHLLPSDQEVWPFANARPVLSVTTAREREDDDQPRSFLSPGGKQISVPVVRTDKALDAASEKRQMLELVSRGVELCVTRMVDTFHLLRRDCYDERFDDAIGRNSAPQEAAELADGRYDPPIEMVRDPGYHLLHRARRALVAKNVRGATKNLLDAFSEIAKRLPQPLVEVRSKAELKAFIERLVGQHGPTAKLLSESVGAHLRLAAAVIAEFPAQSELPAVTVPLHELNARVSTHRAIGGGPLHLPPMSMPDYRRDGS